MSRLSPAFVLGYHGCDAKVAENVLAGDELKPSSNDYDWLGSGIYFWEADYDRAWRWANENRQRRKIKNPAVVGAIIDLRKCLNLATQEGAGLVKTAYKSYKQLRDVAGQPLPDNRNPQSLQGPDKLLRRLDNAVIERLHGMMRENNAERFDTVRGMFREGDAIYPGAGFWEKTHVQIAVRDSECIIAYFRPRKPK